MGLSASQGRMLGLTARLSDLEGRAQSISNQKMRLANETEGISKKYLDALNAKKLTVYNPNGQKDVDASVNTLYKLNNESLNGTKRVIVDSRGNVVCPAAYRNSDAIADYLGSNKTVSFSGNTVTQEDIANAKSNGEKATNGLKSAFGDENAYLSLVFGRQNMAVPDGDTAAKTYVKNVYSGLEAYAQTLGYTTAPDEVRNSSIYMGDVLPADGTSPSFQYDENMVASLKNAYENGVSLDTTQFNASITNDQAKDVAWLYEQLSEGNLFIVEKNMVEGDVDYGKWQKISYSSGDAQLNTVNDDTALAQAEVEYEKAMGEIQNKDKRFDTELKQVETQHSAVQTELESVKKVMDKNIDRTFKLFS